MRIYHTIIILLVILTVAGVSWWMFANPLHFALPIDDRPPKSINHDTDTDTDTTTTQPAGALSDATTTTFSNDTESVSVTFATDQALFTGLGYADVLLTRVRAASGERYESTDPALTVWNQGNEVTVYENDESIFTGTTATEKDNTSTTPLTAHTWVWSETVMNNGDVITPNETEAFTLTFTDDGRLSGTTDCNNFNGQYKVVDTTLDLGPLAMTKKACPESQDQDFIDMVTEADSIYFDENNHLVLLLPVDSGSVIFRPANE